MMARARMLLLALVLGPPCAAAGQGIPAAGLITLDLGRLDDSGLYGTPGGRRSLDYEFCIPDEPSRRDEVAAIDPSARFISGSRGRIGCGSGEVLVLGNTHQPGFRELLETLAALPYVARIAEAYFE